MTHGGKKGYANIKFSGLKKHIKAQDNHSAKDNNRGRRLKGSPSLHHPRTEKQGIEIHRSFNAKVTTVDQAPWPTAQARTDELGAKPKHPQGHNQHHRAVTTCRKRRSWEIDQPTNQLGYKNFQS
jgi:hypothetical protein